MDFKDRLAKEFDIKPWQAEAVIGLHDEGATVPFIARYRKEAHGSLNEQTIHSLLERLDYLRRFEERKEEIFKAIDAEGKMTEEIEKALSSAQTLSELEDIYMPYKKKRRTRASVAKEKGLEPLADYLEAQETKADPYKEAESYIDAEKEVVTIEDALNGAKDILAERASENAEIRRRLRNLFSVVGTISVTAEDKEKDSVYTQYYDYSEPVKTIPDHRILAMNRGEKEGFLKVNCEIPIEKAQRALESEMIKNPVSPCAVLLKEALEDSYTRLLAPSMARETRNTLTERASAGAIQNFGSNLHALLMQPPVRDKVTLGLDPGYRTGCKVAVTDGTGKVLDTGVIYITHSEAQKQSAKETVKRLIKKHGVEVISIGNGTASKETEIFVSDLIKEIPEKVAYMVVSEAGASVYSASKLAAEEFPQFDLTLRSAVSIARRLQDPLSELVKIEPKAIGVGQYQHDMPKKELESELSYVVESCVNSVGVDLNTASAPLLEHVSGISSAVAKNIVAYREENGRFKNRTALKKVAKLGPKAFEQSAGFLRIADGENPLDRTAVHPESYKAAKALLKELSFKESEIGTEKMQDLRKKAEEVGLSALSEKIGVGVPTLKDILEELIKPGRDPRGELPPAELRTDVMDMNDLKEGMVLKGTVRNIVDFGAFVDIGVHEDGLVHISQMSDKFIKHPSEVVKLGDRVEVTVLSVDSKKGRIGLSMKKQLQVK